MRSPPLMTLRLMQVAAFLALAACGSSAPTTARPSDSSERPFTVTEVTTFESPWAMAFLPGSGVPLTNMALVTEKAGRLWLIDATNGRRQEVTGVPGPINASGQGGLAEVVPHPDFAANQRVYLSFSEDGPNGTSNAAIGYGRLILGQGHPRIDDFKVIWRGPRINSP